MQNAVFNEAVEESGDAPDIRYANIRETAGWSADAAGARASLDAEGLLARIRTIQAEVAQLPVLDARRPEEIIGYNDRGHFD
jgi:hypothetical protein